MKESGSVAPGGLFKTDPLPICGVEAPLPISAKAKIGAIMGNDGQWAPGPRVAFSYASIDLEIAYENSFRIPSHIILQSKLEAIL
jgi:hypothetical protein